MAHNMDDKQKPKNGTARYISEVKSEMKKVTWPSKPELYGATIVVIVVTFFTSLATGMLDMALGKVMELVIRLSL